MNPKLDLNNSNKVDVNQSKSYDNGSTDNSTNITGKKINIGDKNTKIGLSINPLIIVIAALVILGGGFGIFKAVSGSSLDSQLVGTWDGKQLSGGGTYSEEDDLTFKSNHTVLLYDSSGECLEEYTWKINDSKNLILSYEGKTITFVWDDSLANGISFYDDCWYLSGDVLYIGSVRYDRQ